MRPFLAVSVVLLALLAAAPSNAQSDLSATNYLGIVLGAAPPKECAVAQLGYGLSHYDLGSSSPKPCIMELSGSPRSYASSYTPTRLTVVIDSDSAPAGIGRTTIRLKDGLVVEVFTDTKGFTHQDTLLEALRSKFGAPDSEKRSPVTTGVGAKFDQIQASWRKPDAVVTFYGMLGSITEGSIIVRTPAEQAAFEAEANRERSF